jgi:CubicO group peptidase (beta-lactamase class C family)
MHRRFVQHSSKSLPLALALVVGFASAQGIPAAKPEAVGLSTARLDKLKSYLQTEVDQGRMPGAVVMILRDGKLVWNQSIGYQDKGAGKALKSDAIFRIYSMTKPLVTVAAMTLVEDGKIQLTDPISKYLPEFANMTVSVAQTNGSGEVSYATVPANRPITVQDLMRHTSGIGYAEITKNPALKKAYIEAGVYAENGTDYDARGVTPHDEVVGLAKAPLSTQPGTNWEYGMSVDVLGRVVEAASGMRLSDFVQQRLFGPLKMTDSGFRVPAAQVGRIAQPLPIDPLTNTPNKVLDVTIEPKNDSAGAGGVSTAADYLRFCDMLLHGGELDGTRILSPTTVRLMTSDSLGASRTTVPLSPGELLMGVQGYTFGLGFMVRQGPGLAGVPGSEGEYMWAGAAGTFFWIDPKERLAVVAMMQVPGPSRPVYRRALKQLVYAAITNETPASSTTRAKR